VSCWILCLSLGRKAAVPFELSRSGLVYIVKSVLY